MARLFSALGLLAATRGFAYQADPHDIVSLLQQSSLFQQGRIATARASTAEDKCLKFIHNPRTGGTTVDSLNLHLPKGHRAYRTLMEGPLDRAAGGPLWPNLTAGQLFDQAHGMELADESSSAAAELYTKYIPLLNFRFCQWPHDNYVQICQDLHTPPHHDELVAAFFSEPGCTNFCVVRDPLKRLLSTYKFRGFGPCSEAGFDAWIRGTFPLRQPVTFCHAYPQVEYVYNAPSKANATKQWCHRVLRLEHFEEDYNKLMIEFGKPLRLGKKHLFSTGVCKINATKISREAKDKVYDYYRNDYDAFGYAPP